MFHCDLGGEAVAGSADYEVILSQLMTIKYNLKQKKPEPLLTPSQS